MDQASKNKTYKINSSKTDKKTKSNGYSMRRWEKETVKEAPWTMVSGNGKRDKGGSAKDDAGKVPRL
jgi:hypothetical protein